MNKKEMYGSVTHNNNELIFQQYPYVKNAHYYEVNAKDEKGNEYLILWEITNFETENEDECCDWDNFEVINEGNKR